MAKYLLKNKKIIITGASSGIGRELVKKLLSEYSCTVWGISRNEEKAEAFCRELNNDRYSYKCFDVGEESNWINFRACLEDIAFIPDVIINNAGVLPKFSAVDNTDLSVFKHTMQVDFWSAVYCVKYLGDIISRSPDPAIINVSSSSALATLVGTAPYTSAKTALRAFTECYSVEQKGKKYVAVICPGFTRTDIFRSQSQGIDQGIVGKVSTPTAKMVKKILKGISRRRKRMVFGKDAKLMNLFYKIVPSKSAKLFSAVMKKSKLELFSEIFETK